MSYATIGKASPDHGTEPDIFGWRARFTLEHYRCKGFGGGCFQQHDGQYNRSCLNLDYTPDTLDEVIERFLAWCDVGYKFPTASVSVNGKTIRKFKVPR